MNRRRKWTAVMLCLLLTVLMMPTAAYAEGTESEPDGDKIAVTETDDEGDEASVVRGEEAAEDDLQAGSCEIGNEAGSCIEQDDSTADAAVMQEDGEAASLPAAAMSAEVSGVDASAHVHASISISQDTYTSGETAAVSVSYKVDRDSIHAGDHITIVLPDEIVSSVRLSLPSLHFSSYEELGGGQYRLIFAEGVETAISGGFSMYLRTDTDQKDTGAIKVADVTREITVLPGGSADGTGVYDDAIMKDAYAGGNVDYGGYDYSEGYTNPAQIGLYQDGETEFLYRLFVNDKQAAMSGVTVVDTLPDGMDFDTDKEITVTDRVSGDAIDPDSYEVSVHGSKLIFKYPGEFSSTLQINYWVRIPEGSKASYTNRAVVTYESGGETYQESRKYILQSVDYHAASGEKSVNKTEISDDPADQWVTYTIKFWQENGFDIGEVDLTDQLDEHVRFLYAEDSDAFEIVQDQDDPQLIHIRNVAAISGSAAEYVRFVCDFSDVPDGYTVRNTVGGNTTATTKHANETPPEEGGEEEPTPPEEGGEEQPTPPEETGEEVTTPDTPDSPNDTEDHDNDRDTPIATSDNNSHGPKTGDGSGIATWVISMAGSLSLLLMIRRRRSHNGD